MPLNILIVEDNPDWESVWTLILDVFAEGSRMIWATSVSEAEEKITELTKTGQGADLIISDIFLSGSLTGIDFFNRLSTSLQHRFVFVSSVASNKVRSTLSLSDQGVCILQKPFGIRQAVSALRETQGRSTLQ